MPVIIVESGKIGSKAQKEALIQGLTKTTSEVLKVPEQAIVIFLKENDYDNIGTGGKLLSTVKAERSQA